MVALAEILRRFRFHGVPGAPAAVGVPADRTLALEDELAPVFAALDGAQRRASDLLTAAEHDAARRRSAALEEGQRIVAEARAGVMVARAEATAARVAVAEAECRRLRAFGQAEVQHVRELAAGRTDALVELIVAHVLALGQPEVPRP